MKTNLRYLLPIIITIFLLSCNISLELPTTEKFQYLSEIPRNIFIDESNNRIILLNNTIYKIKDLNITNEKIELKDNNSKFYVGDVSYSVDKDGNGILIYSRINHEDIIVDERGINIEYPFYSINIEKNQFKTNSVKHIFDETSGNRFEIKIINLSKNNHIIYYYKQYYAGDFYRDIKIKKISNDKIEDYTLDKKLDSRNQSFSLNIDEKGNGLYLSNTIIDFKIFSINNFTKGDEKLSIQFMDIKDKIYTNLLQSNSDNNGNGYILFDKVDYDRTLQNHKANIYINKFNNFKASSDKELIFSSIDLNSIQRKIYPINIDKNSNGIIFMLKRNISLTPDLPKKDMDYSYLYTRKITNLKVEDKEIKILDSNKYFYHDFKINEKGNGLAILSKNDSENTFIVKKIINFEPEK